MVATNVPMDIERFTCRSGLSVVVVGELEALVVECFTDVRSGLRGLHFRLVMMLRLVKE